MPEFVEYSSKLDIIHIKSFGIVTKEEIKQSFKEINALMEKMDNHKILVDHSEASSFPGNVEAFNFGSGIALTFKNAAIAIIHSEKNSDILKISRCPQSCPHTCNPPSQFPRIFPY